MEHSTFRVIPEIADVARHLADKAECIAGLPATHVDYRVPAAQSIVDGLDRMELPEGHPFTGWRDQLRTKALELAQPGSTGF